MELGRHLRELSRLRFGVAICVLIATFAALSVSYKISLLPPHVHQRSLEMAAASTEVLVDTPTSVVLDLRQDTSDVGSLTNRAVLIGNVMASAPVRAYIGHRAGVPGEDIRATTPRTPNAPRPFETPENKKKAADLLASTDQYRLNIEANPTVPVLKIYAQAPSALAAGELANASVDGLRDYLAQVARSQRIPPSKRVRIEQFGRARGTVVNGGVSLQATTIAFVFFFAVSAAAAIFVSRVRRGFKLAEERETLDAPGGAVPSSLAGERVVAR
jgi:hypothetical protein